jgi:hypothetical protein
MLLLIGAFVLLVGGLTAGLLGPPTLILVDRYVRRVLRTLWALPPLATLLVYSLAVRVRWREGHWPWLGHPKAGTVFTIHDFVATVVFLLALYSFVLAPLLIPGLFRNGHMRRLIVLGVAAYALEWVGLVWLFRVDPGGTFGWLLD